MSHVYLPNGYSRKARSLFKNLKDKNALSIADETSAPTIMITQDQGPLQCALQI